MKRKITELSAFEKAINRLIARNKVLKNDFEAFKENLSDNPEIGDLMPGTGGVRKTRLVTI